MPVFFADHTGKMKRHNAFFRPVHIGAALVAPEERGPEPDCNYPASLSDNPAYADLRLYHYLRSIGSELPEHIAIMQYRRRFIFTPAVKEYPKLSEVSQYDPFHRPPEAEYKMTTEVAEFYDEILSRKSDDVLQEVLGQKRFMTCRLELKTNDLGRQYLRSISRLYPDEPRYQSILYDAIRSMIRLIGHKRVDFAVKQGFSLTNNCFVTRKPDFLDYSSFLWTVLDDLKSYDDCFRIYGYLAERIFSVYAISRFEASGGKELGYLPMFLSVDL